MGVFMPTLSSLYFSLINEKVIEFHEELPPFKRRPMSVEFKKQLEPHIYVDQAENISESDSPQNENKENR